MSIWKREIYINEKPWGNESVFHSPFGMSGKIININPDCRTSLKYYKNQNQMMYCLKGEVSIFAPKEFEFGDEITDEGSYFILKPGDIILIEAQNPYRISALTESSLVEVIINRSRSTEAGSVILQDDYGRETESEEEDFKDCN
jgi:uncharacterized RmlC-like cupin family protein